MTYLFVPSRYFRCAPNHGVLLKVVNVDLRSARVLGSSDLVSTTSTTTEARKRQNSQGLSRRPQVEAESDDFVIGRTKSPAAMAIERNMAACTDLETLKTLREDMNRTMVPGEVDEDDADVLMELFVIRAAELYGGESPAAKPSAAALAIESRIQECQSLTEIRDLRNELDSYVGGAIVSTEEADALFEQLSVRATALYTDQAQASSR